MSILTEKWLKTHNACQDGIDFAIRNNLIGFPFHLLEQIKGDINNFISWIKVHRHDIILLDSNLNASYKKAHRSSKECWYTYDDNENLIHEKNSNGFNRKYSYDNNNNVIHIIHEHMIPENKNNDYTFEIWYEYDENNNLIYQYTSDDYKLWFEYDSNNNLIHSYNSHGLDEKWFEYDIYHNMVYKKTKEYSDSEPAQEWYTYDDHHNILTGRGVHYQFANNKIDYYPDGQLKQYNELYIPYFRK